MRLPPAGLFLRSLLNFQRSSINSEAAMKDLLNIHETPSPNHHARPSGVVPDLLVIHGTVGTDAGDLSWCTDPRSGVSYHYLILRDGAVHQLVSEMRRAWHAGVSSWMGRPNCNDYSIGIGLSNRGPGEPYTDAQYGALAALTSEIMERHPAITSDRIVGHHQVSPGRKTDPWDHFDWPRYRADIGATP